MKVLLINPNTTTAMTDRVLSAARAGFGKVMAFEALTAARGVEVIASRASYAVAAQSVLETWAGSRHRPVDAIVVACFGDPGVAALRELAGVPVYGLAESTLRAANAAAHGFAVVTAGRRWESMLGELVAAWGLDANYRGTYAIDATGLGASAEAARFRGLLQAAIDTAHVRGAGTIVLGGAALAGASPEYRTPARLLDCLQTTLEAVLRRELPPTSGDAAALAVPSQGLAPALAQLLAGG